MKSFFSNYSKTWLFSLICIGLISVLYIFIENRNHGINMVDFEVFYKTAERMFQGSNLYQVEGDGHYVFKYASTSAAYFIPFILLPIAFSKVIYWLILCLLIVEGYYLSGKLYLSESMNTNPRLNNTILFIAFAATFIHIERELVLGQINFVLLVLYLWMAFAYINRKPKQLALSLALSIFIKPFGLIFIPYLLLTRKIKALTYFVSFTFGLFLTPLIFYNLSEYQFLLQGWINELVIELGNKQALTSGGIHTIFSLLVRYTPLYFINFTPTATFIYQLLILALLAAAIYWFAKMGKGLKHAETENIGLLIALIPLLAYTNENAFLFLTPAIIIGLKNFGWMNISQKILLITGILLQGGNIREIWGMHLSLLLLDYSLVAIGALLIIITMFSIRYRQQISIAS